METSKFHNFEILYNTAQEYSKLSAQNFEEVAIQAFALHDDSNLSKIKILKYLEKKMPDPTYSQDRQDPNTHVHDNIHLHYDTWELIGPTGSGKSTFINHFAKRHLAKEGAGIDSETSEVRTYFCEHENLYLVDTPGLNDTRPDMTQEKLMKLVTEQVEKEVRYSSRISAVILVWSPTNGMKISIKNCTNTLKDSLGKEVFESMMIVVNKELDLWREKHDWAVKELRKYLEKDEDLKEIPIVVHDLKLGNVEEGIRELRAQTKKLKPYNEEKFEKHRKELFRKVYDQRIKADEEQEVIYKKIEMKIINDYRQWKAIEGENSQTSDKAVMAELRKKREEVRDLVTKTQISHVLRRTSYLDRLCEELRNFDRDIRFENGKLIGTLNWILLFLPPLGVPLQLGRLFLKPAIKNFFDE